MSKKKNRKSRRAWLQVEKADKPRLGRSRSSIAPEHTAQRSQGRMSGRITLKQYLFLVRNGFDGDKIKGWTNYRASKEIGKVIEKEKGE